MDAKSTACFTCKKCSKKYKSKGGLINHEKKCIAQIEDPPLENSFAETSIPTPKHDIREPEPEETDKKPYSENELIILKASDFDRMITDYLKIFIEHYNTQMTKLIDENRELVTYSNTLAEILKSIVCSRKTSNSA
jgi:hypothetical protein